MQAELRAEQRAGVEVALDEFLGDGTEFGVVALGGESGKEREKGEDQAQDKAIQFHRELYGQAEGN